MADNTVRALICLVEGDSGIFRVKPTGSMDMMELRDLIWEKGIGASTGILAKDLILWMVRISMASDDATHSPAG